MLIQIHDADKSGKRRVTVSDANSEIFSADADDLAGAHRLLRQARKNEWKPVTADALAADTKAAKVIETARVEASKAAASPKGK